MTGEPVIAPLKACPKCGHPGGLIFCPICHTKNTNEIIGGIFVKDAATQKAEQITKHQELADEAAKHRNRTLLKSPKTQSTPESQTEQLVSTPKAATASKAKTVKK